MTSTPARSGKRKSREDWLRAGLRRLARVGVDAVRVEPLARQMGVTKGSFYWHFEDRPALLRAMLDHWAESATESVIARAETAGSDPRVRLERLTSIAAEGFDAELELALRDWAQRDNAVATVLDRVDRRRMDYLRALLRASGFTGVEAEARAFLLYSALLGDDLLPEVHGRFSRKRVLAAAIELLVSPRASSKSD